jgi:hypothetical protein
MSFVDRFQKWLLKTEDKVKDKINGMTGKETFKSFNRDNINTQYENSQNNFSATELKNDHFSNSNDDNSMQYQQIQNTESVNPTEEARTPSENLYPSFRNLDKKK